VLCSDIQLQALENFFQAVIPSNNNKYTYFICNDFNINLMTMFFNLFAAAEPSANVCLAHGTLWHRIPYHKGSNKSNQLINRVFNAIHSGKDTVKQWYCYNRIELWLRISSQAITVCSARGTLVGKLCLMKYTRDGRGEWGTMRKQLIFSGGNDYNLLWNYFRRWQNGYNLYLSIKHHFENFGGGAISHPWLRA